MFNSQEYDRMTELHRKDLCNFYKDIIKDLTPFIDGKPEVENYGCHTSADDYEHLGIWFNIKRQVLIDNYNKIKSIIKDINKIDIFFAGLGHGYPSLEDIKEAEIYDPFLIDLSISKKK
jgi:hypothetical protein